MFHEYNREARRCAEGVAEASVDLMPPSDGSAAGLLRTIIVVDDN